tara:strand:- start:11760 stop:13760 length:2001 start_codon:yes stop_codon:yes gene_type:complete
MGTVIEVDWFNTYLLKKVTDNDLRVDLETGQDFNTPRDGFALSPGIAYPGQTSALTLTKFLGALTDSITSQGSGYTDGEYNSLTVATNGNGVGAAFSVVVNSNVISVTVTTSGRGYAVGDTITLTGITGAPSEAVVITLVNNDFNDFSWYVEESRIRGGYNNPSTDKGVKAFINEPEPQQQHRFNTLIYSGVYNSRTGVNDTNVFSVSDDLTRSADPQNGSIQKTYAEDTNLIVFQEDKISRALIDKDTIYTTEGGTQTQAGAKVLGQIVPYKGEYGISNNPESFAVYGYRKYFADRDRSAIMRLSNDGLTEISAYGMTDYFRDELALILNSTADYVVNSNSSAATVSLSSIITLLKTSIIAEGYELSNLTPGMLCSFSTDSGSTYSNISGYVTQVVESGNNTLVYMSSNIGAVIASGSIFRFTNPIKPRIVGGWDIHNKNYVVSLQKTPTQVDNLKSTSYKTLTFDESINGWVSFATYKPEMMGSLKNNFYTFTESDLYEHYDETTINNRGIYYGVYNPSTITFVFNPSPSTVKVFKTVEYEGSNGWEVESYVSGFTEPNLGPGNAYLNTQDTTNSIYSYDEGLYTDSVTGQPQRAGFNRKEDRYVANLVSSSVAAPDEVRFGPDITGIKGYFATVKVKTDVTTQQGGTKELWAVGTEYVQSTGY